ncbi:MULTISPECIES: calcium-binding protein [unclassified Microcoleus]|uniref:calcium-binding protein n=1 Tax=unclassified Microcoleus TaxID=2642155 RepID=UPI002FD061A9
MTTSDTKTGRLDNNDFLFPARYIGGYTWLDEYDLNTDAIGQGITLALDATDQSKFDTFLEIIDANTGKVLADNDDEGGISTNSLIAPGQPSQSGDIFDISTIPDSLTIDGTTKYKVRVFSVDSVTDLLSTYPYTLQATVPNGNVSLVPRGSNFSSPLTGSTVALTGKLEVNKDFTFPGIGGNTLADEFLVSTSLDNEPLKISLSSTTIGFDPFVAVISPKNPEIFVSDNNSGGGLNSQLTVPRAGIDYRIRVSSNTTFPNSTASAADYSLQVSVAQGSVTLTPRSGETLQLGRGGGKVPDASTLPDGVIPPLDLIFTPVTIATPTINAPGSGNPTGQSANTVTGLFYNLSDSNDDILLFSLPSTATGKQILALSGSDKITGTSGADTVNGMQGADTIDGGAGNDSLSGGKESDSLEGGAGNDQILGNNDNDTLTGGEGNDTIRGGKEKDSLTGGGGDDFLYGDRHQDFLTGGDGNDTFVLAGGQIAALSLTDADVITDFKTGDKIGLTDGNTFGGLSFENVSLTLTGQPAVNSIAIKVKADSSYLGIVQGVAQSALTANAFVIL